jgi:hypothetical protein
MNSLIDALAPVFVASFALQQLIELLDPILEKITQVNKKWLLSAISLSSGLLLTIGLDLRILRPLGVTRLPWLDAILTALFLTGGTKAINDLIKLVGYKKEQAKAGLEGDQIQQV